MYYIQVLVLKLPILRVNLVKVSKTNIRPEQLIDIDHYRRVTGQTFATRDAAYRHFCSKGQAADFTPSPFLFTNWYIWRNPDCVSYPSIVDHYSVRAVEVPIDPAPFIDGVQFLRVNPQYQTMAEVMLALVEGRIDTISPVLGDHLDALHKSQRRVHKAIGSSLLRDNGGGRRRLVWVQSGTSFRPSSWFRPERARSWDLLCNWYARSCLDLRLGEVQIRQSGTKATGIHHVLNNYPKILSRYDQVIFLDDDLEIEHDDLDIAFDLAEDYGLDLFQPSVAPGSQCYWPDLFQAKGSVVRLTTGVEIMMPGFSRRALALCAPAFEKSVSGFGLDFAFSELVRAKAGNVE